MIHAYWREFGPPVHVAVAAYLGITKRPAPAAEPDQDFESFMQGMAPQGWG